MKNSVAESRQKSIFVSVLLSIAFAAPCALANPGAEISAPLLNNRSHVIDVSTSSVSNPEITDESRISQVFAQNNPDIRWCMSKHSEPTDKGSMTFMVRIDPKGALQEVRLNRGEVQNTHLARCISTRIARWSFPALNRDQSIELEQSFIVR